MGLHVYTGRGHKMVRQIYYLRRNKYKDARECSEDLHRKGNCILPPKTLIAFERSNEELDDITISELSRLFKVSKEELLKEDNKDWRELNVRYGK